MKALNKWKDVHVHVGRLNTAKTVTLPTLIYRVNATPVKTPAAFLERS